MKLFVGTQNGVFRLQTGSFDEYTRVLDSGDTLNVRAFENHDGVFAASKTGLYRSLDDGETWKNLHVPRDEVYAVVGNPDGTRLYAGTHPAHLYVSTDDGQTWRELESFRNLPSRTHWHTARHRGTSHVRSLGVHPDAPTRVIAGVEVGGVHISDDNGETWQERRDGLQSERDDNLQYDVHHVLVITAEEYVTSCGGGLYRTSDAGKSWTRLDTGLVESYFQEACFHQGTLFAAAQSFPPTLPFGGTSVEQDVNAALYESKDRGNTLNRRRYPGEPTEFIYAWTAGANHVLAGTTEGRVIIHEDGEWTTVGNVPTWVRSLQVVEE